MGASLVVPAYQARSALNVARFSRCARRRAKEHCLSDHRPQICGRRRLRDSRAASGTGAISSCWCRRLLGLAGPSIWQRCARGSPVELGANAGERRAARRFRCAPSPPRRQPGPPRRDPGGGTVRWAECVEMAVIDRRAGHVREGVSGCGAFSPNALGACRRPVDPDLRVIRTLQMPGGQFLPR